MEQPLHQFPANQSVVFLCNYSSYSYYLSMDRFDYIHRVECDAIDGKIKNYGLDIKTIQEDRSWPNNLTDTRDGMDGYYKALQLAEKYLTLI